MSAKEVHLILNPTANKGRSKSRQADISSYLKENGLHAVWHVTEAVGHAGEIAKALPQDCFVVAIGGDGTIREVAAACAETERTLAVLPAGSGNDYVKALGVGTDMKRALEILARGKTRLVDVGEVNGVRFNNGLGIGFDAEVAAGVAEAPAYLGGFGRYMWSVGRLLWGFQCHEARVVLDGGRVIESDTILVAAALGTTYGARFRLAPTAKLDDGLFDVIWSEKVGRAGVLSLLPRAFGSSLLEHPKVHMERAREIYVTMADEVPAHVDGEMLAPTKTFQAHVIPGALRIVAP